MDEEDRKAITRNLLSLVHLTNLDSLVQKLVDKNVFSERMVQKYLDAELPANQRKRELYLDVQLRGPCAFRGLIQSLVETAQYQVARILVLRPQPQRLGVAMEPEDGDTPDEAVEHRVHPFILPFPLPGLHQGAVSTRLQNLAIEENEVVNVGREPLQVEVKLASQRMDVPSKKALAVYRMASRPKGLFLLINNIRFDNGEPERLGAEVDQNNLTALFEQLGYQIFAYQNLTLREMRRQIFEFAQLPDHSKVDSCVVSVLSHGHAGMETNLVSTDGCSLSVEWVISQFKNEACPQLQNKPKIFIFQSCRGDERDFGVVPAIRRLHRVSSGRTQSDGVAMSKLRTYSDMLIAHSTLPGYVSHRDIYQGTWFVQAICKTFMHHSHDTDIEDMLKMVDQLLADCFSENQSMQTSCYENRGFRKFFFNPGLYVDDIRIV
ncbi:caspase-2 [Bacillus rossius redtenbacheri]|uniref:caspase-2 n=1 Tax=Bacillus rossius redtenbacheri TaxID=93214 RepID=UPI002FDCA411